MASPSFIPMSSFQGSNSSLLHSAESFPESVNSLELLRRHYLQRLPHSLQNWHEFWLCHCVELGLCGLGCVAPNPLVGAVLVRPKLSKLAELSKLGTHSLAEFLCQSKILPNLGSAELSQAASIRFPEGLAADWSQYFELLGQGYHRACGHVHAEVAAFADANRRGYGIQDFRQAILYCNLEPCCFAAPDKKQPPCCEEIVRQELGAVIFANIDPNPAVAGRGAERLQQAGITVRHGDFAAGSALINQIFFQQMQPDRKRPWVSLKMAQSLDGYIATKSGDSQWITGPVARSLVQALRGAYGVCHSAVGVGRRTLEADDPSLELRPEFLDQLVQLRAHGRHKMPEEQPEDPLVRKQEQQPWRVVWDSQLRSSTRDLQFYRHAERSMVIHQCKVQGEGQILGRLPHGMAQIAVKAGLHSAAGLAESLETLAQEPYHVQYLLLEGGSQLASSFLAAGLADELYCFVSQRLIGGAGLSSLQDLWPERGEVSLAQTLALRYSSAMLLLENTGDWSGPDEVLCHGYLREIIVP